MEKEKKQFLILRKMDERWEVVLPQTQNSSSDPLFFEEKEAAEFLLFHKGEELIVLTAERFSGEPEVHLREKVSTDSK